MFYSIVILCCYLFCIFRSTQLIYEFTLIANIFLLVTFMWIKFPLNSYSLWIRQKKTVENIMVLVPVDNRYRYVSIKYWILIEFCLLPYINVIYVPVRAWNKSNVWRIKIIIFISFILFIETVSSTNNIQNLRTYVLPSLNRSSFFPKFLVILLFIRYNYKCN